MYIYFIPLVVIMTSKKLFGTTRIMGGLAVMMTVEKRNLN